LVKNNIPRKSAMTENSCGVAETFTQNSILSLLRLFVSTAIAIVLPSYLVYKLPATTYAAWVLIIQVSAYVAYFDFGIQTGISKYVAEYKAKNDNAGLNMRASAGLALMMIASTCGLMFTLIIAWQVPKLFKEMPSSLYHEVQISIIFVGVSLSFGLLCSIFSSIFLGLQRYAIPVIISLINRFIFTTVVVAAVFFHQSLAVMGALVAFTNIATGLLQIEAWRRWAKNVRLRLSGLDLNIARNMLGYCSSLAIWTAGMLCVSGIDVIIVGRYDFAQTGYYSVATLPTTFIISIMSAALAPLMPAVSAFSVHHSPAQLGVILSRSTRYALILLLVSGLPLLVGGYWVLHIWVGPIYAFNAIAYMRILVIANILRNICAPYSNMLVATESQNIAIAGVIAEATVNVICSIYLAERLGAIGVAYGTLLGSFVSVGTHFTINMHYTYRLFAISRARLLIDSLIRPCAIIVPSIIYLPYWWSYSAPVFSVTSWIVWGISTILLAWYVGFNAMERCLLVRYANRHISAFAFHQ